MVLRYLQFDILPHPSNEKINDSGNTGNSKNHSTVHGISNIYIYIYIYIYIQRERGLICKTNIIRI